MAGNSAVAPNANRWPGGVRVEVSAGTAIDADVGTSGPGLSGSVPAQALVAAPTAVRTMAVSVRETRCILRLYDRPACDTTQPARR